MAPRRSHLKSRNGCFTCKKRRVKCDESGPPCTNCKTRGTECSYPVHTAVSHGSSPPAAKSPGCFSDAATISSSISSASATRHVPELRLMHRWSTVTCESMVSEIADDREIWRTTVPECAMKYDFLLNSLFALTAFHLAHERPDEAIQHIGTALEYQTLAFAKFRSDLENLPAEAEAHDALLYCSIILMVLALASSTQPALRDSMLQNTIIHFELVRGVTVVMMKRPECLKDQKLFGKIPDLLRLPQKGYSAGATRAIQLLGEMNDLRMPMQSNNDDEGYGSPGEGAKLSPERLHMSCKNALWWLDYLQMTCGEMKHRGFALSWHSLAGDDFIQAVKEYDPVALLATLWWGVFLNPMGEEYWYGEDFGKDLASEIVEMMKDSSDLGVGEIIFLADQEFREQMLEKAARSSEPPIEEHEEPIKEKPFWEGDEDGSHGNVPAVVLTYTRNQNAKLFADITADEDIIQRLADMQTSRSAA